MKAASIKSLLFIVGALALGSSYAITSDDIDNGNVGKNSSLEAFSVEIRGPGGKRIDDNTDNQAKKHVISNERLGIKPQTPQVAASNSGKNVHSSEDKSKFSGFFDYKFPEGYNVNASAGTVDLKSGETLWKLASRTRDPSVTVNQQIASIFRRNLSCFPNGRLNARSGCIFTLPTPEQSKMEDSGLAKSLIAHNGVSFEEYRYAMAHCSSGICGINAPVVQNNKGSGTTDQTPVNEKISLSTNTEDGGTGVIYYTEDKKDKKEEKKAEGKEIKAQESFVLLDDKGRKFDFDRIEDNKDKGSNVSGNEKASGATLTFSKDDGMVKAMNSKGEIISEVSQKYDSRLQDMDDRVSGASNELMAARSDIADLKQEINELKQLIKEKEAQKVSVVEVQNKQEDEVSSTLIIAIAILCGFFIMGLIFMIFLKRKKYRKEIEEETAEDMEDTGDFDHLMTLDTLTMPNGSEGAVDLNMPEQENKQIKKDSDFVVASDNTPDVSIDDLQESSVEKVNIDNVETVVEDPSKRTKEKIDISNDDLVPSDTVKDEPLDESLFLDESTSSSSSEPTSQEDEQMGKEVDDILSSLEQSQEQKSIDLDSAELDESDIDDIITNAETVTNKSVTPEFKAETLGNSDIDINVKNEDVDDIDALIASTQDNNEKASSDDIDDILAAAQGNNEKASSDDIDDILAAAQSGNEKASSDDIDDILASVQSDSGKDDAAVDDIDALIASAQEESILEEKKSSKEENKVKSNNIKSDKDKEKEGFSSPYDNYSDEEKEKIIKEQEEDLGLANAYININSKADAKEILNKLLETAATKDIRDRAESLMKTFK